MDSERESRLEEFFAQNAGNKKGATLYYNRHDLPEEAFEGDADALENDPRVEDATRRRNGSGLLVSVEIKLSEDI